MLASLGSPSYIMEPYDNLLKDILENGFLKKNRTGIDTLNLFGTNSRYRINDYFPLLTGRKIWPKSIWAELLWVLSGSTNVRDLQALGSHIWDAWENKDFEKRNGYYPGSLGPIYGYQLRQFDGCSGCGDGFDQLEYMVNLLKTDPDSRRNLFSLWNPKDIQSSVIAPCHWSFQIYTDDNKLYGLLNQRSADVPIGVPANIQFYSTLLYMLGQETGYIPYELIHSIGVAHIYVNQIDGVKEYLSRFKPDSPKLKINPGYPQDKQGKSVVDTDGVNPDGYLLEDFLLFNYNPMPPIKMPVAV